MLDFRCFLSWNHIRDNSYVFPAPLIQTCSWLGNEISGFILDQIQNLSILIRIFKWSWEMLNIIHVWVKNRVIGSHELAHIVIHNVWNQLIVVHFNDNSMLYVTFISICCSYRQVESSDLIWESSERSVCWEISQPLWHTHTLVHSPVIVQFRCRLVLKTVRSVKVLDKQLINRNSKEIMTSCPRWIHNWRPILYDQSYWCRTIMLIRRTPSSKRTMTHRQMMIIPVLISSK